MYTYTCYNSLTCLRSTRSCNINLTRESTFFASITWLTLLKYFSIRFCRKKRTFWISSCLLCHMFSLACVPFLCHGPFPSQWWTSVWQSTPETLYLKMTSAVSEHTRAWWLQKVATEEGGKERWLNKMKSPCQRKWGTGDTLIGTQCQLHLTAVSHTLSLNSSPMNLMFPRDLWRALKSASSNTSFRCFLSSSCNRGANNVMVCVPEHVIIHILTTPIYGTMANTFVIKIHIFTPLQAASFPPDTHTISPECLFLYLSDARFHIRAYGRNFIVTRSILYIHMYVRMYTLFPATVPYIRWGPNSNNSSDSRKAHRLGFLHCLLKLVKFLVILLVFLKLFLALCQQEGTEGLHFGGAILIDTNFDLVLYLEERELRKRLQSSTRLPPL